MIKGFAIVFYFASLFDGWCAENITPMPAKSGQLLLVTAPSWNATEGTLFLYSRSSKSAEWVVAGRKIPVVLGRTGLKWGLGLHPMIPSALVKREGDGGSPAGIFALDTAFGAKALPQLKWPWLAITRTHAAVDDARSRQYNRIVDSAKTKVDWQSFENMRPKGGEYDLGIVVKHNWHQKAGAGSCIFLHIWSNPTSSTSGCTAMSRDNMARVIRWLDPLQHPILVQFPQAEYENRREAWRLPKRPPAAR